MKRLFLFTLWLQIILISCHAQNSKLTENQLKYENEMEQIKKETYNVFKNYIPIKRFDIEEFNLKNKRNEYRFIDSNGMEVFRWANTDFQSGKVKKYWENRNYPHSAYRFVCSYDADGFLIHSIIVFHNIEFGWLRHYDRSGNVVTESDLDIPYEKFSMDDLIDKMKTEYRVDITDTRICRSASRGIFEEYDNHPLYCVDIKGDPTRGQTFCYLIDGISGETLYTTIRYGGEKKGAVVDEYFNSIK